MRTAASLHSEAARTPLRRATFSGRPRELSESDVRPILLGIEDPYKYWIQSRRRRGTAAVAAACALLGGAALFAALGSDEGPPVALDRAEILDATHSSAPQPAALGPVPEVQAAATAMAQESVEKPPVVLEEAHSPAGEAKLSADPPEMGSAGIAGVERAPGDEILRPPQRTFWVQLAAMRSPKSLEGEWERLSAAHSDLFGGLKPAISVTQLGDGRTFYRLRTGPFQDRPLALQLCQQLGTRRVQCIVVSAEPEAAKS